MQSLTLENYLYIGLQTRFLTLCQFFNYHMALSFYDLISTHNPMWVSYGSQSLLEDKLLSIDYIGFFHVSCDFFTVQALYYLPG